MPNQMVTLRTKKNTKIRKTPKDTKLTVAHAKAVLSLPGSQWELNDTGWKWDGKELAVNSKK